MKAWISSLWTIKNYRLALLLSLVLLVWMVSGLWASSDQAEAPAAAHETVAVAVKARQSEARLYYPVLQVRASTEANRRVEVRAEVAGRIRALPAAEGSLVQAGEVLCELEPEDRALRVAEAEAAVEQAQIEYDGSLRLKTGGYQSAVAIAGAKTRLQSTRAELLRRQLDLSNTRIVAPFAGYVAQHAVEVGDFVQRADLCAVVIELDPLRAVGRLAETEVGLVAKAAPASLQMPDGSAPVTGVVQFVGREADSATRTYRVEATFANPEGRYVAGMTASLRIPLAPVRAHLLPSTLLSLDDQGQTGVRIVDAQQQVRFVRVGVLGDDPDGIWVQGLPEQVLLITVGQGYVSAGETVEVTLDDATTPAPVPAS